MKSDLENQNLKEKVRQLETQAKLPGPKGDKG